MKISEEFPSKYLKASDLQGREVKVVMANVEREKIGDDHKPVLYFKGKDKGVVLNKTNAATIGDAYGDDTDDWYDQKIILFSVMVDFQGKVGPAIRMRVPTARDRKKEDPISTSPKRMTGGTSDQVMDDEIPF